MYVANLVTYFDSVDFYDMVEDMYDGTDDSFKKTVETRMSIGDKSGDDMTDIFKVIRNFENSGPMQRGRGSNTKYKSSRGSNSPGMMKGFGI